VVDIATAGLEGAPRAQGAGHHGPEGATTDARRRQARRRGLRPCEHDHIDHIDRVDNGSRGQGPPEGATQERVDMVDIATAGMEDALRTQGVGHRGPGGAAADARRRRARRRCWHRLGGWGWLHS
jgi:hypothetical protein